MLYCCFFICFIHFLSTLCTRSEFDVQVVNYEHRTLPLWTLLCFLQPAWASWTSPVDPHTTNPSMLTYARADLFELQYASWKIPASPLLDLIPEGLLRKRIWRKRGSRGGIRNRVRRQGSKLPLPLLDELSNLTLTIETQACFVLLKCGCLRTLQ